MSEALTASRDVVLQLAAAVAGFAEARVVDTATGKVVLTRARWSNQWGPFEHLEPGECALSAFYGCAFWERPDVLGLYRRQEEQKAASRASVKRDVRRDFVRDIVKRVMGRPEGKHELLETLATMGAVRR